MDSIAKFLQRDIPQTEAASELQVPNSAGGYSFALDDMKRLERFLILGSDGGSYYIGEQELTGQNIGVLAKLTASRPIDVVRMAVDISLNGRSYKNNMAIFAMAFVMTNADDKGKSFAREQINAVVRTSTHLFTFNKYLKLLAKGSGLGTSRNRAIASWYESKSTGEIAYQAVKYRQRQGWTHRDALRQSRPKGIEPYLAKWILGKTETKLSDSTFGLSGALPAVIDGFERVQKATNISEVISILLTYGNLPWEAIPTQFLKEPDLWKTLFYNGQLNGQALVRNITRLARIGAFKDLKFTADYAKKLLDKEMIVKTRLHPIQYLNALVVHKEGQVQRRDGGYYSFDFNNGRNRDWETSSIILDALDSGYDLAFASVVPANKRTLIAVDVSGSMSSGMALGLDLSAAQVSGAMASIISRTEPMYEIMGFASEFRSLGIHSKMDLNTVMKRVRDNNFGSTDCGLPMRWALNTRHEFDTFVVITDNETYAGSVHPHKALQTYRQKTGIDARLVVVGVASNGFTIADPTDSGMMDVVGADSNLPKLIAEFSSGRI